MTVHHLGPPRAPRPSAIARLPADELRLRCGANHLHSLGSRCVAEFVSEVGRTHGILPELLGRLDAWRSLPPDVVRAVGADRWPPVLCVVPRETQSAIDRAVGIVVLAALRHVARDRA